MALVKNSVKLNNGKAVFVNGMNEYETLSLNFARHHKIAERLLAEKYSTHCVIKKFFINNKGVVTKEFYGTTSNSPMIHMAMVEAPVMARQIQVP